MSTKSSLTTFPTGLTPDQHEVLERARGDHARTDFAVVPSSIPLNKVVATSLFGTDLDIEFDRFENIPAGSVKVRGLEFSKPVLVRPMMTHASIVTDAISSGAAKIASDIDWAHDALMNEGTLHQAKFLGALKDQLLAKVLAASPLETAPSFLAYSPAEILLPKWGNAISAWMTQDPEGKKARLQANVYVVASMLYVTYRDEYRLTKAEAISATISAPKDRLLLQATTALWGKRPGAVESTSREAGLGPKKRGARP